ncbi:MAG TPA: PAS domain-containing protein [Desulfuromonadales bacterium]|nr:PAS domain-containing protein [Desulfuromonadales bacterium]
MRNKLPLFDLSPGRLLWVVILVLFIAEIGEWLIKAKLHPTISVTEIFIDVASMLIVLWPAYYFFYRPFKTQWQERQQMEEELRKSEERLRLALEGTKSGLWDWDLTTDKGYYSPSGERILGYAPGELDQSVQTWKDLLHPEDRLPVLKLLQHHLDGRSSFYETEHRLRRKSGEWSWFHAMGQVIARDSEGRALRMVGTFNEATKRKTAEEQIHQLYRHLDRTEEYERAGLARDLHDELGQLVTVLQLELGSFRQPLPEQEHAAKCKQLIDLTTQLAHGIRNVTARLRPPALDTGLVPAMEYNLDRMEEHLKDLRITLHAPGLERQRLQPDAEIALFRIYQEALSNVIKHARARTVDIRLQQKGDEIIFAVQDDGVGFEPDPEHTATGKPSGLGLVGMRERLTALGGRLEIISAPGRGTTIMAVLPYRPLESGKTP